MVTTSANKQDLFATLAGQRAHPFSEVPGLFVLAVPQLSGEMKSYDLKRFADRARPQPLRVRCGYDRLRFG
jgi:hypothetical protein